MGRVRIGVKVSLALPKRIPAGLDIAGNIGVAALLDHWFLQRKNSGCEGIIPSPPRNGRNFLLLTFDQFPDSLDLLGNELLAQLGDDLPEDPLNPIEKI